MTNVTKERGKTKNRPFQENDSARGFDRASAAQRDPFLEIDRSFVRSFDSTLSLSPPPKFKIFSSFSFVWSISEGSEPASARQIEEWSQSCSWKEGPSSEPWGHVCPSKARVLEAVATGSFLLGLDLLAVKLLLPVLPPGLASCILGLESWNFWRSFKSTLCWRRRVLLWWWRLMSRIGGFGEGDGELVLSEFPDAELCFVGGGSEQVCAYSPDHIYLVWW